MTHKSYPMDIHVLTQRIESDSLFILKSEIWSLGNRDWQRLAMDDDHPSSLAWQ